MAFEWKAYAHDAPSDLLARLEHRGFEIGEREAVMVYDLTRTETWIDAQEPAVVRVDCPERVEHYRRVAERVFGRTTPSPRTSWPPRWQRRRRSIAAT